MFRLLLVLIFGCLSLTARGELLDSLPRIPQEPLTPELRQLAAAAQREPENVAPAIELARAWYRAASGEGELRFAGYARGALDRWWNLAAPPDEVLEMRANLRQYVHDFDAALADLGALLARQPEHAQALAIRAAIRTVRAEYAEARADCARLAPLAGELIGFACGASLDGLTGDAAASHAALSARLANSRVRGEQRLWVVLRLAEMAERLGNAAAAERHYRQALFLNPRDQYTLVNYADFLLDHGRPADAIPLLHDRTGSEHLLLRLVLAERQTGAAEFTLHADQVATQFAEARRAGHAVHEQEEARFVLRVQGDAGRALRLALANWRVQREPRDARAVLEAALAAGNAAAARPVLQWMAANHIADVRLGALAAQLDTLPRANTTADAVN